PQEVYKDLADSYESLKGFMRHYACMTFNEEADGKFYKALRRMYYANVACFLCQYHDDTPLNEKELTSISTFQELPEAEQDWTKPVEYHLHRFLLAWGSLCYNLVTNDGEEYRAQESYRYIQALVILYARAYFEAKRAFGNSLNKRYSLVLPRPS